jgi:serine/threonine protein kinase
MDNSPATSRASSTTPPELPDIAEANKLIFSGVYDYDPNVEHGEDAKKPNLKIYDYDPNHFIYVDIIESSRHIVKEFHYHNVPLLVKMAVKTIRIPRNRYDNERDDKIKRLTQEITTFRALSHHPSIVNFYGLCFNNDEAMICMELMNMSLYDLYLTVHDTNGVFPEKILGYIAIQILEALGFCKSKNIIHRDVKPKNILLNLNGEVKLCDFGESRILKGKFGHNSRNRFFA